VLPNKEADRTFLLLFFELYMVSTDFGKGCQ